MKRLAARIVVIGSAVVALTGASAVAAATRDVYPQNAAGKSFGSELLAAEGQGPDLTLVVASNGREGYVDSQELKRLTEPDVHSPAEALAWQQAMSGKVASIPVYLSDGRTQVGVFDVSYPTVQEIEQLQTSAK